MLNSNNISVEISYVFVANSTLVLEVGESGRIDVETHRLCLRRRLQPTTTKRESVRETAPSTDKFAPTQKRVRRATKEGVRHPKIRSNAMDRMFENNLRTISVHPLLVGTIESDSNAKAEYSKNE
ncbi:hypothetical protein EVAR_74187_1 [Eumeta japonica]|uniref:Uncharacterized protein n=1 Tax=Eumeta variegata TaxID=151549 RepID=A0A4C1SF68_EUMVA|nr:hypothetical protein EVAR_74187_1 [Eumeta japonica]